MRNASQWPDACQQVQEGESRYMSHRLSQEALHSEQSSKLGDGGTRL